MLKQYLLVLFVCLGLSANSSGLSLPTELTVAGVRVSIIKPMGQSIGQILILPGWNYSRQKTITESNICPAAIAAGYTIVIPEMLKSVYARQFFPETRKDWVVYPLIGWITDSLIPFLQQKQQIFLKGQNNYIFGISTGARGQALILENELCGSLFCAAVGLSGDYNQLDMPNDPLMTGFFGPYASFKERWQGLDNPWINALKIKIPILLCHGSKDQIVPVNQTKSFFDKLMVLSPQLGHELIISPDAGHNQSFWDSQTKNVLLFFQKHACKKNQ